MKKLVKCFLLAASVALLFAGCNGLNTNDATVDADGYSNQMCLLSISVDGAELASANNGLAIKSVSRTISPVSLNDDLTPIAKYTLKGVNEATGATLGTNNAGFELNSSNAVSGQTNTFKVSIPYGQWDFTLEATDSTGNLLLKGESFKDLRTSTQSVSFTLTTDGVPTPGSVSLTGSYEDAQKAAKSYKAGLYDTVTGSLKYPVSSEGAAVETKANTTDALTFAFSASDVAPGRYSFQIRFYNDVVANHATAKQIGYWESIVVVAPGRATTYTIPTLKIINQRPKAPEKLRAYYKTGSETLDGYTVILTWSDKSDNEENFVLTVYEYDDEADTTGSVYKILGVTAPNSNVANDKHEVFYGSSMNAGGSLHASSKTASIKLPYGKIFDFVIQAENFVGLSDSNTDTAALDPSPRDGSALITSTEDTPAPSGATFIPFADSKKINRFVVDYYLNGGTLTLAGASEPYNSNHVIKYGDIYSYASDARNLNTVLNDLLPINNNSATANHLVKDAYPFNGWQKENGTAIGNDDEIDFSGINVKATYDTTNLISYIIVDEYLEISSSAYYDYDASDPDANVDVKNTAVNVTSNKTFTITADVAGTNPDGKRVKEMRVKITSPRGGTAVNEKCTFTGTQDAQFEWDISTCEAGIYTVAVEAYLTGESKSKSYSMSFSLNLTR